MKYGDNFSFFESVWLPLTKLSKESKTLIDLDADKNAMKKHLFQCSASFYTGSLVEQIWTCIAINMSKWNQNLKKSSFKYKSWNPYPHYTMFFYPAELRNNYPF